MVHNMRGNQLALLLLRAARAEGEANRRVVRDALAVERPRVEVLGEVHVELSKQRRRGGGVHEVEAREGVCARVVPRELASVDLRVAAQGTVPKGASTGRSSDNVGLRKDEARVACSVEVKVASDERVPVVGVGRDAQADAFYVLLDLAFVGR